MTNYFRSDLLINTDDPIKKLTNVPLSGRENYLMWARVVTIALGALGKGDYINGEIKKVNEDEPGFEDWQRNDSLVMCWLLNSMEEKLGTFFLFSDSSLDLWKLAKKMYGPRSSNERIFQLKQEIANMKQGTKSVVDYFGPLMAKFDEMALYLPKTTTDSETFQTLAENEKVFQLLAGLNSNFEQVRDEILLAPELPSVYTVLDMLRRAETVHKIMNPESAVTSNDDGRGVRAATAWCDHCQKAGHAKERCWVLYPNLRPTKDKGGVRRGAVYGSQVSVHHEGHSDIEYDW